MAVHVEGPIGDEVYWRREFWPIPIVTPLWLDIPKPNGLVDHLDNLLRRLRLVRLIRLGNG